MKRKIISIIMFLIGITIGIFSASYYIIHNVKITMIEQTDYGALIHYELYEQEFGYFIEYNEMEG